MLLRTDRAALGVAASLFRGLGDPTRLAILQELTGGERRVVDLVAAVGLTQGTVSGHLACLRDCGLVIARPEGRQMFYSLAHLDLLDLFAVAETLLAHTGSDIALCPNYGPEARADSSCCADSGASDE